MSVQSPASVKIGTRSYTVDLSGVVRRPLNSMRQMVDQGNEPGEQSFDNQGVWKRTCSDFVLGAGQTYFDQEQESVRRRYRTARAVDTLSTRRAATTLKQAQKKATISGVNTNAKVRRTGSNYWFASGTSIRRTNSLTDFTLNTVTGAPGQVRAMVAFDAYVYCAFSASGVYRGAVAGSSVSSWSAVATTAMEIAHGRFIGANNYSLFEIAADGSLANGANIYDHPDTQFQWKAFCAAPNGIYASGTNGVRNEIHLVTVIDATGQLAPPIPVAELPAGEQVNRMAFFGGFLFFATSKGIRIGNVVGGGSVAYGPLLRVGNVNSIHSDGRFGYFTWEDIDDETSGIGRLSLERFTTELVPAYTPDLSTDDAVTQVLDVSSDSENPVFVTIDGSSTHLYAPHSTHYDEGILYSGAITYGTPELKAAVSVEARWEALPDGAQVKVEVLDGVDGTNYGGISSRQPGSTYGKATFSKALEAEELEVKVTLTPSVSSPTEPVTLRRWTLRSLPMPFKAEEILLPVIVSGLTRDDSGQVLSVEGRDEWEYLKGLERGRSRVRFTFGGFTEIALVDAVAVFGGDGGSSWHAWNRDRSWPDGVLAVRLITVEDGI